MDEYLEYIEKHIKRSVYPIALIVGGLLIGEVYQKSDDQPWQLIACAFVLITFGFAYLIATGISAIVDLTAVIKRLWLKFIVGTLICIVYLAIFLAGVAAGLSTHSQIFNAQPVQQQMNNK